jgi:hypothetical protein
MPLMIKTAVHDGHTVRAVLVTMSFQSEDIDNLVGEPVGADVTTTTTPPPYSATYTEVSFYMARSGTPGFTRHCAGTTVPGYLIWDGERLCAASPRQFAEHYTVVDRETPAPRISHHHG